MGEPDLPQFTDEQALGDLGVRLVEDIVADDLKWICRPQPTHDLGIDAQVESLSAERKGTGRLVAVQIKCGETFFAERESNGFVYRGELKHLHYWVQHSLPVILVICHPKTKECWWQEITPGTVECTEKAWKLVVPFAQRFHSTSKDALQTIGNRPQNCDLAELLLYRFLCERYGARIEVCPVLDLPRDFFRTAYFAKIDGKTVLVDYAYQDVGRFTKDRFDPILDAFDYNGSHCGTERRMLFLISQSRQTLDMSSELDEYFRSLPHLQVFRLQYTLKSLLDLQDIHESQDQFFAFLQARFDASAARSRPTQLDPEPGSASGTGASVPA
jgi:hypothetical protein